MNKIALSMIVKGTGEEPARLRRALTSISPYVDAIYITLTSPKNLLGEAEKVCKEFNVNVSYYEDKVEATEEVVTWLKDFFGYEPHMKVGDKLFDFGAARNYCLDQIPQDEYPWIVWMDTDDIFRGGDKLHKLADLCTEKNIEAVYFNYIYQADIEGDQIKNIVIEHLRERLVRNNGHFKWIAPIHETLIEQTPTNKTDSYDCDVVHLATQDDRIASLTRNLSSLELSIYQSQGKDPRHIYYLAKAFYDLNTPEYDERTIPLIMSYLYGEHKSGWTEERSQASVYLAEIYKRRKEYNNAIKSCMNALIEFPMDPTICLTLATIYVLKQDWDRALFWVRLGAKVPDTKTTLVHNPRDLQAQTLEILYNVMLNKGQIDEAYAAAEKMKEIMPNVEPIEDAFKFISNLRTQRDITKKVLELADYLKKTGEVQKIKPLLAATPAIAEQTPFIVDLNMKNNPPTPWGEDEIAIWCGPGFTTWSPKRIDNPMGSFVGGSEEAVIRMARELSKLGWKVTVYADPGADEGEYDGVRYLPHYKFNHLDHFNIIIAWRQPRFFEQDLKYKKGYVWLHDIQNPLDYTDEAIKKTDKFLFLSKWHRENVDKLPDSKVFLTTNGI